MYFWHWIYIFDIKLRIMEMGKLCQRHLHIWDWNWEWKWGSLAVKWVKETTTYQRTKYSQFRPPVNDNTARKSCMYNWKLIVFWHISHSKFYVNLRLNIIHVYLRLYTFTFLVKVTSKPWTCVNMNFNFGMLVHYNMWTF